jgi:glutamate-5-semialdehyde dehydrogenase
MDVHTIAEKAKKASRHIAVASTEQKNTVLKNMINLLEKNRQNLVEANRKDLAHGEGRRLPANILRRLVFNEAKVDSRIQSLGKIIELNDPIGQIGSLEKRPNGMLVGRMRVPLGVILMIYEARPHVTINAGAFALKSGNCIILKGGKEAATCNAMLGTLWKEALVAGGLTEDAIQCITASHEEIANLLLLTEHIDLVIPRGGKGLIRSVVEQSKIPVIKHFEGICHVYVDDDADIEKAERIVLNSKLLMPEVCNAAETVLVSAGKAEDLPRIIAALHREGVEVRGCSETMKRVHGIQPASEEDWKTEYLDKIYAVKLVKNIEDAIEHINTYGSGHTDTIVTENYTRAKKFLREVDSGVVLVNASTMFDDGEELGMGAEIGISTDKLHARGPMGLAELTTYKFIVLGDDHIKES